ncbi:MAG TPA: urate hydroxylase PuuD [Myxococcaceae bacterium]|nr:urate hydroxylase PuuD [Myxococcaceae bacterium]
MEASVFEWLNLFIRWTHVFAGILWIGQTYLFTWLDKRLEEATRADPTGKVWMVHSGGFYLVGKQKVPEFLPQKLHWFRWEAAATWVSGMLLLILVYHLGGLMVDESVLPLSTGTAVAVGLLLLPVGWLFYDSLWRSPLSKHPKMAASVSFLLLTGIAFGLTRVLSGRAAYMHVGALMGTVMAANVWFKILPAQRQLVVAIQQKTTPDATLAAMAKSRSKHNTYLVVPLVFIMISNHFPSATYGNEYNWAILAVLVLVGWAAAKVLRG